ncbi:prepilin-type N-terminal cleavage/methylation domain-containing protein [bacterium]|nr:prepilin-type N-terminal cleavage/methylation domain-containing protein [bacterium]
MKQNGFTLLELMLTLTLFAAVMGLVMNLFFQFKDQTNRFDSILDLRQESRILEHLLRQDLQSAVYLANFMKPSPDGDDGRQSGIVGVDEQIGDRAADRLHLHVNRLTRFHRGLALEKDPEIHEVSYYLEETTDNRLQFKRREQFYVDIDITEGDGSIVHALSDHVVAFDLQYYRQENPEPIEEWGTQMIRRQMETAVGIPAGVTVTLKLQNEAGESVDTQFQINLQPEMGASIKWAKKEN